MIKYIKKCVQLIAIDFTGQASNLLTPKNKSVNQLKKIVMRSWEKYFSAYHFKKGILINSCSSF